MARTNALNGGAVIKGGLAITVNFMLPFVTYTVAQPALGDGHALALAALPPLVWASLEFARTCRIDALSLLVLAGSGLSLLAVAAGGNARVLQLREQLVAAVIGLVFLASAALKKPLIYQLARARMKRRPEPEAASFEALKDNPVFRRAMLTMTVVWGVALVVESAVCCALVFVVTIRHYLIVSPIIGYSTTGALSAWSFWYARRRIRTARRQADSRFCGGR
jgi:hypothetical protein